MTVVPAFKLDDQVAARRSACQAYGTHDGFGSGIDHPHHVYRRYAANDFLSEFNLLRTRHPETRTAARRARHRFNNPIVRMTENRRAPRTDVVDVGSTIDVRQATSSRLANESRDATDGAKRTNR